MQRNLVGALQNVERNSIGAIKQLRVQIRVQIQLVVCGNHRRRQSIGNLYKHTTTGNQCLNWRINNLR